MAFLEGNTGGGSTKTTASGTRYVSNPNPTSSKKKSSTKTSSSSSRSSSSSGYSGQSSGYGSSGGGNYGGGGYSVGSTSSGTISKPATPPPPISIDDFLAKDTAYRSQKNAYQQALKDYEAQYKAELGKYGNEYNAGISKLGQDRTLGLTGLQDDYASRGMITSGVYGQAVNDYNKDMDTRQADMLRAKQAYEDDLLTGKSNFSKEQQALLEKAKQDALNRRLDSIG